MAVTQVELILKMDFIPTVSLGILGTTVFVVLGSHYLFVNRGASNRLYAMTVLFSNTGYLGTPLFIAAFGKDRVLPVVIGMGLNVFFYGAMTAWVAAVKDDSDRRSGASVVANILGARAKNPLVVAPVRGMGLSAAQLTVPLESLCRIFGNCAAPGGLFALGLFLVWPKNDLGNRRGHLDYVLQADRPAGCDVGTCFPYIRYGIVLGR